MITAGAAEIAVTGLSNGFDGASGVLDWVGPTARGDRR